MADQIYRVVTIYDLETGKARTDLGGMVQMMGQVPGQAEKAKTGFGELVKILDHLWSLTQRVGSAFSNLLGKAIEIGSHSEVNKLAMAGMVQAGGFGGLTSSAEDFQTAMEASKGYMEQIRADADRLPGTADELREIVQSAISPGGHAGMSLDEIRQISGQTMAVGKAFGVDAQTIGHGLSMMLEGHARSIDPLFRKLSGYMKGGAEGFNKMTAPERVKAMNAALAQFAPMIDEYGNTWDAVSSTVESAGQEVWKAFSLPVFEAAKGILLEIGAWYDAHREQVKALAVEYGEKLAAGVKDAWQWTKEFITTLREINWDDVKTGIEAVAAAWVIYKAATLGWATGAALAEAAQWALNIAMAANPIGIIVIGIAALGLWVLSLVMYYDKLTIAAEEAYIAMLKAAAWAGSEQAAFVLKAVEPDLAARKGDLAHKQDLGRDDFKSRFKDLFGIGESGSDKLAALAGGASDVARSGAQGIASGIDKKALDLVKQKGISQKPQVNISGGIHLTNNINQAESPDRVLVDTRKALEGALYHPTESPQSMGGTVR